MEKHEVVVIDLEQLATLMAQALPDLECPACCGPVYTFIETGAGLYREEMEWAWVISILGTGCRPVNPGDTKE